MPRKSKYDLYSFAHCKIPHDQYTRLRNLAGDNWAELARDLVEAGLVQKEDEKE